MFLFFLRALSSPPRHTKIFALLLLLVAGVLGCGTPRSVHPSGNLSVGSTYADPEHPVSENPVSEHRRWAAQEESLIREIRGQLSTAASLQPTRSRSSFSLSGYTYWEVQEPGAPLPALKRVRSGTTHEELVFSTTLGRGGYPFLLSHYALCTSGPFVALTGTVGNLSLLCVRDPSVDGTDCVEETSLGSMAWSSDCATLFYTRYRNGRADELVRVSRSSLSSPVVLLREENPAFSLSLTAPSGEDSVLVQAHSARISEYSLLTDHAPPRVLIGRSDGLLVALERGFGRWLVLGGLAPQKVRLAPVISFSPLTLDSPLWETTASGGEVSIKGFAQGVLITQTSAEPPRALILPPSGDALSVSLPTDAVAVRALPAQDYQATSARIGVAFVHRPEARCDVSLVTGRLSCPAESPTASGVKIERLLVTGNDGTRIPLTLVLPQRTSPIRAPLLHVYGAYGTVLTPRFSQRFRTLLDAGVPLAFGHIRGGGENGAAWHRAAVGIQRQRSVNDTLIIARALAARFGNAPVLAARSAGAVTAALALLEDQSAFSGALLEAPFLDVLSALSNPSLPSTVREYDEWGDPSDPAVRQFWTRNSTMRVPLGGWEVPVMVSVGARDPAIEAERARAWTMLQAQARHPHVPVLLQWMEDTDHHSARFESDEQRFEAERIAALLRFTEPLISSKVTLRGELD